MSPAQVAAYIPTNLDTAVAGALLAGMTTIDSIALFLKCQPRLVRRHMINPVAMRWISDQIQAHVGHRLGIVTAAMFSRAASGDVGAARLVLEKYQQLAAPPSHVVHHKGFDLSHLSDDELSRLVADKLRTVQAARIIDVPAVEAPREAGEVPEPRGDEGSLEGGGATPPGSDDSGRATREVAVCELPSWEDHEEAPEATELDAGGVSTQGQGEGEDGA